MQKKKLINALNKKKLSELRHYNQIISHFVFKVNYFTYIICDDDEAIYIKL